MSYVNYAVYRESDGLITSFNTGSEELMYDLPEGQNAIIIADENITHILNGVGVKVPKTESELLFDIRFKRNNLLRYSDWTQASDVDLTSARKNKWKAYRQALRDFTETCDPHNPVWPTEPSVSDPLTPDEIKQELVDAVQNHLDNTAKTKNYDGILSLCSYAMSTKNKFKGEGEAGLAWRDACWDYCYQVLADVQNELRTIPTSEELVAELPEIVW